MRTGGSDFLIPPLRICFAGNYDEANSPDEGTRLKMAVVIVGRVPSPGVSLIFRGIKKADAGDRRRDACATLRVEKKRLAGEA
jgi:hypothetical protein